MKNTLLLSILTIFLVVGISLMYVGNPEAENLPIPTDLPAGHHEDAAFKQERKAFFEQMHRAAPDTDWRAMDRQTRKRKAQERFASMRNRSARSGNDFEQDSIANGQLLGHWREVGSNNQAGRSHFVEPDTNTGMLYVASAGGNIWKGPADGSNWQVLNDLFKIPNIISLRLVPVKNAQRLIVASGAFGVDGLLYSDDDGLTWNWPTGLPGAQSNGRIQRTFVANDSLRTVYVFYQASFSGNMILYRSDDQGESFSQVRTFSSLTFGSFAGMDMWMDYYREGPLYLIANAQLYQVDSVGVLSLMGALPAGATGSVRLLGVETSDSTVLYAAYAGGSETDVYRSTDGGLAWAFQGTAPTYQFSNRSFTVSAANPEHLYTGGIDTYRSHDGGLSWTLVNSWADYYGDPATKLHADIPGINSYRDSQGNEILYVNTDGGTYLSTDSLMSVQNLSLSGLNISQYYSVYTNRWNTNVIFAGSQDQGFQRTTQDNGREVDFEQTISGDYGHIVSSNGGNVIWTNYPGFTMIYPNASFSTYNLTLDFPGSGHLWLAPLMADPLSPIKVYLGGGGLNGGAHLFKVEFSSGQMFAYEEAYDFANGFNASISAMAYSPVNPSFRYVTTDIGGFFVSGDGGNNWTPSTGFLAPQGQFFYGASILPSPAQLGRVYVAGSGYSNSPVFVSNDGTNFVPASNGLPSTLVYDLAATEDEKYVFAATEVGPYVYVVADDQWYPMEGLSAPDQIYWSVEYIPSLHTVRFGTYGRGIWDFVICDDISPLPEAQFSTNVNDSIASFLNASSGAYFYQWDFGDGATGDTRNAAHGYVVPGTYTIRLIAQNFCSSDTFEQTITVGLASSLETGVEVGGHFSIFPNPGSGPFTLRYEGVTQRNLSMQIRDITGKVILQQQIPGLADGSEYDIPLRSAAAGIYLLSLTAENGKPIQTLRLLVQ